MASFQSITYEKFIDAAADFAAKQEELKSFEAEADKRKFVEETLGEIKKMEKQKDKYSKGSG